MLRGYERVTREEANASQEERELWWHWDSDGSLVFSGRLPAEDGMAFLRALETSRSQIRAEARAGDEEDGSAEPRADDDPPLVDSPPTNADALCRIAESYLARGPTPVKGAERHHVIVHVDAAALSRDGPGRSQLADGPAIAPEVARRLGCDASLSSIVKRGRKVLSVGRKTRAIPAAIDRALASAIKDVAFRAAREPASSTRTTSATGRMVARPRSTISSCSAAITTASSTRAGSRSDTSPAAWCSATHGATGSIPPRRYREPTTPSFGATTASPGSRSAPTPCSPAPARR